MKRSSRSQRLACSAVTATLRTFADFTCLNVCILTVQKKPKRQKGQGLALLLFTKSKLSKAYRERKGKDHLTSKENDKEHFYLALESLSNEEKYYEVIRTQEPPCLQETEELDWFPRNCNY